MSVSHLSGVSTVSGMIVASSARGPRGVARPVSAEEAVSRINRRMRSFEVRPRLWRSRARTLRWPSP